MKSTRNESTLSLLLILVLTFTAVFAIEPYGAHLDTEMHCDDCSSSNVIPNGYSIKFYGENYNKLFVTSNGILTFDRPGSDVLAFLHFIPNPPIIAAFMIDLDTELVDGEVDGTVFYRTDVGGDNAFDTFALRHFGLNFFTAFKVVATWAEVKTKEYTTERNTFQAVVYSSHYGDTVVCFNYPPNSLNWPNLESIEFPTAGFYSGPSLNHEYYLEYSGSIGAADLDEKTNTGVIGQHCYIVSDTKYVDYCLITDIDCNPPRHFPVNTPITFDDVFGHATLCADQTVDYNPKILTCEALNQYVAVTTSIGDDDYCKTYFVPTEKVPLGFTSCPSDIVIHSNTQTTAHWLPPTPIGDCVRTDSLIASHYPDSSYFSTGTTLVSYIIYDVQYNSATCSFEVTVEPDVRVHFEIRDALTRALVGASIHAFVNCLPTDYLGRCTSEAPQYRIGDFIPAGNYYVTDASGRFFVIPHSQIYVNCYNIEVEIVLSPPGFYRSSSGDIFSCHTGSYSSSYEATKCLPCAAGTYSSDEQMTHCDQCPPGYSSTEGASTCFACSAGYYLVGNQCLSCPAGTFSCDRATKCEACPEGAFSFGGSATCGYCSAGYYYNSTLSICTPCPANHFSNDRAAICTPCPAGSFSTEGSIACTYCEAGFYYHPQYDGFCAPCEPGTFSHARASECTPCPPGGYSSHGATECEFCSAGYYRTSAELFTCYEDCDTCDACPAGTFSCDRSEVCEDCPPGTWSLPGSAECFTCNAGYYLDIEAVACEPCPWNTFSNDHALECLPCPDGSYNFGGSAECYFCIAGYYFNSNTLACEFCPAGTFSSDRAVECTPCPPGAYSFAGSDICSFCTAGYYLDSTSASCLPCPAGTFSCDRSTECEVCPEGSTSYPGSAYCTFCDGGYFFEPISQSCQPCPAGTFSNDRATECTPCPAGFFSFPGSFTCYSCLAGSFLDNNGACIPCPEGYTSGDRATECILIPITPAEENVHCLPGYYLDLETNTCLQCPANHFSPERSIVCLPCPAGSYSPLGSETCTFCEAGYYLDELRTTCYPCPMNTFSSDRATECTPCPPNHFSHNPAATCEPCPEFTLFNPQSGHCEPCPVDSFIIGNICVSCSDWEIPEVCDICIPGNEPELDCVKCYPDYYSPDGFRCIPCPYGTHAGFGFTHCVTCDDGYFWDYRYGECRPKQTCTVGCD